MVKHTQKIRRQFADELLSVFDHFVKLALKELRGCPKNRSSQSLVNLFVKYFRMLSYTFSKLARSRPTTILKIQLFADTLLECRLDFKQSCIPF